MPVDTNSPIFLSLFEDALRASEDLLRFSRQNCAVLSSGDDEALENALREREKYIKALAVLENEIDLALEKSGLSYDSLPPEAEKVRSSIRSVLREITELDTEAIKILSRNLKKYRDYTIRMRNKKHISAYIRTSAGGQSGGSLDIAK